MSAETTCLIASAGLLLWLEYGGMTPVGAAMALDHPQDPMALKLERAGESHSHTCCHLCLTAHAFCYGCCADSCLVWNLQLAMQVNV